MSKTMPVLEPKQGKQVTRARELTRIVIFGGGVGGLSAALRLDQLFRGREDIDIVLIDQSGEHLLAYRLTEFAAGHISHPRVVVPIELVLRDTMVKFLQARVERIDPSAQVLRTTKGEVPYDYLIASPGGTTNYYNIPGLEQYSIGLKTLEDGLNIRDRILDSVAKAAIEDDKEKRKVLLTFVIGGGGFTGVELAASMAEWLRELAYEAEIDPSEPQIIIVEKRDQLAAYESRELSDVLEKILVGRGVKIIFGKGLAQVDAQSVTLSDGTVIPTNTVIWTGGVKANPIMKNLSVATDTAGRAIVMTSLTTETKDNVYAIGDAACCINPSTNLPAPDLGQIAGKEGVCAAENIYADIQGERKRSCKLNILGIVIGMGTEDAVALVKSRIVTGALAKFIEYFRHYKFLYSLGGVRFISRYFDWAKQKEKEEEIRERKVA